MSPSRTSHLLVTICLVALVATVAAPGARARVHSAATAAAVHILFIGNSYTRANDLPHNVQRIAEGVPGGPSVRVTAIANPGWDLARHWFVPDTRAALAAGGFTHVVLQGHSLTALQHRDEFEGYARLFHDEIDRSGARTVLYETWARRPGSSVYREEHLAADPVDMQVQISDAYVQIARDLGADVAPAGRAFLLAQQRLAEPDLYRSDGAHPSRNGTFLAASVLYAVIAHQDPRRSRWRPHRVSRHMASDLRDVAWVAVNGSW